MINSWSYHIVMAPVFKATNIKGWAGDLCSLPFYNLRPSIPYPFSTSAVLPRGLKEVT